MTGIWIVAAVVAVLVVVNLGDLGWEWYQMRKRRKFMRHLFR